MKIPDFNTKKELFAFLAENKQTLIAQKKAEIKHADGVLFGIVTDNNVSKAAGGENQSQVKAIINTTNLMDSHKDVHIPGLWAKSLKENKNIMHIQEHKMSFESIISDGADLKTTTKEYKWKELGYAFEGNTEALVFDSTIKATRNPFMMKQYRDGNVKNHSVGMQYVKLVLCINDEDSGAEYEAWEKYYPMIANKSTADGYGYFWAVKEAKVIEGSAVPIGSNFATPTLDIKEPPESTPEEPSKDTQIKHFFNSLNY
jgi:hypothetical protein